MAKAPRKKKETTIVEAPVVTVEETQEVELVAEAPEEVIVSQEVYEEVAEEVEAAEEA